MAPGVWKVDVSWNAIDVTLAKPSLQMKGEGSDSAGARADMVVMRLLFVALGGYLLFALVSQHWEALSVSSALVPIAVVALIGAVLLRRTAPSRVKRELTRVVI